MAQRPSDADIPSVAAFLKTLARSGLFEAGELPQMVNDMPAGARVNARVLADQLVRSGRLSRFQARKLIRGAYRGLVLGPFQVLAPIGKGGMSTVYLARDRRDQRLVALKVLSAGRTEPRLLTRFRREMDLSRLVVHPNLCRTFEVGEHDGVLYLAMEYIPGRTLTRLVLDGGRPALPRAARLLAEVATGLAEAHAQGLIHRDLKPSNVMVTPHDHAKLLDLGLALVEGETIDDPMVVGGKGYVVGTVDYMAPEQTYDATAVDARSDLYALGCTAFFTLAGRPPFPGGTRQEKMERHRTADPVPLAELCPGLPVGFVTLVRRLMAKDPAGRPGSAREVAEQLRAWANDAPLAQVVPEVEQADFTQAVEALREADTSTDFNWDRLPLLPPGTADEEEPKDEPRSWAGWLSVFLIVLLAVACAAVVIAVVRLSGFWQL
jgi:eukaryotic-like serine/threonine-protein kinase